ncbi:hypothetical protein [Xylanimonas sp. McL0601]|uniref:hypothetical protein n=1 Tax=Xylanimonas sp. McL0601 TaxID=3414739 RepID=UPI003CF617AD
MREITDGSAPGSTLVVNDKVRRRARSPAARSPRPSAQTAAGTDPWRTRVPNLVALLTFGAAFGYVEAAVVVYLRRLLGVSMTYDVGPSRTHLDLGFMSFVTPTTPPLVSADITRTETLREAATIVMLAAVAWLAARSWARRSGAFLVAFATWDITYYLWLRMLVGWPQGLGTKDVFFLIPVTWVGPVATPLAISTAMLLVGAWFYLRPRPPGRAEPAPPRDAGSHYDDSSDARA